MNSKTIFIAIALVVACASVIFLFFNNHQETDSFMMDADGGATLYSKDNVHVYTTSPQSREKRVVEKADPVSFKILISISVPCVPDKQDCVYDGNFPFGFVLAKDNRAVYDGYGNIIPDADPATFEILKSPQGVPSVFSRDSRNIYAGKVNESVVIIPADYASFKVLSQTEAEDKNHKYFEGEIVK